MLIHDIIADAVEMCGGSRQLLRILNRLGYTSSPDTHDRYVAHHATQQRTVSLWNDLSPSTFTVATVDNFDMLQSYSAVYCGNQQRSYHGTTVQIVQPNSDCHIVHNNEEPIPTFTSTVSSEQQHSAEILMSKVTPIPTAKRVF